MWSVLLAADPLLARLGGKTTHPRSPNYTHVSITPMFRISEPAAVTLESFPTRTDGGGGGGGG